MKRYLLYSQTIWLVLLFSCQDSSLKDARQAYAEKDYTAAAEAFATAESAHPELHQSLRLAKSQALFGAKAMSEAERGYLVLQNTLDEPWQSKTMNNLGLIALHNKQQEQALERFKTALLRDPENESARYNYELLKRKIGEDPPPPWQPPPNMPPPPAPPEDEQPAEQAGSVQDWPELRPEVRRQAIRELQRREKTYYQELKKVQRESGYTDPDQPNW